MNNILQSLLFIQYPGLRLVKYNLYFVLSYKYIYLASSSTKIDLKREISKKIHKRSKMSFNLKNN